MRREQVCEHNFFDSSHLFHTMLSPQVRLGREVDTEVSRQLSQSISHSSILTWSSPSPILSFVFRGDSVCR